MFVRVIKSYYLLKFNFLSMQKERILMGRIGDFIVNFGALIGIVGGLLSIVRYDISKLEKKIDRLEKDVKKLGKYSDDK